MLGQSMVREGRRRGWPLPRPSPRGQADITREGVSATVFLSPFRPSVVFNCAAFTQVDACETEQETRHDHQRRCGGCPSHESVKILGIPLGHVSSDYVFDGRGRTPYLENICSQSTERLRERVKGGEKRLRWPTREHFVVRASWLFGPYGPNFVGTMLRSGRWRYESIAGGG